MSLTTIYIILLIIGLISLLLYFKLNKKIIRLLSILITTITIVIACVLSFNPLLDNINYGLDLQGGFEVLYEVSPIDTEEEINSDMLYNTYKTLKYHISYLKVHNQKVQMMKETLYHLLQI